MDTDEFRDVSAKVERRESTASLKRAADIIDATVQVCMCAAADSSPHSCVDRPQWHATRKVGLWRRVALKRNKFVSA